MIEYLYDAIRVSSGHTAYITAKVLADDGTPITEGCNLMIYSEDSLLMEVEGLYTEEVWLFEIPAEATKGYNGRYWYCICNEDTDLCFKQPIYFLR